jgi:hypothetical protein
VAAPLLLVPSFRSIDPSTNRINFYKTNLFIQQPQTINMRFSTVAAAVLGASVANAQVDSLISQLTSNVVGVTSNLESITSAIGSGVGSLTSGGVGSVRTSYI